MDAGIHPITAKDGEEDADLMLRGCLEIVKDVNLLDVAFEYYC